MATRSAPAAPDLAWTRPEQRTQLRLEFDVGLDPAERYAVHIDRQGGEYPARVVEATAVTDASGVAVLILEDVPFEPGDYRLRLTPEPSSADAPAFDYTLRVEAP
jgi:hypothetical protein